MLSASVGLGLAKEIAAEFGTVVTALAGARRESRIRVAEYCERLGAALNQMSEAFTRGDVPYAAGHEFKDAITELRPFHWICRRDPWCLSPKAATSLHLVVGRNPNGRIDQVTANGRKFTVRLVADRFVIDTR